MTNFFSQRTEERRKKVASFFRRYPKCNTEWNAGTFVYMECFYCCRMRNIEGPASLSPLLSSIMRKKEGTTEKYCCPLSERKEKDAYSTTNWKLNGKQGICLLLVPYIPVLKSFWMCLFHEVAFQMQKRKKNHTGRERNCGGREQWDRKRKQEILLYPLHDYLSNHAYFQLRRRKKGIATRPQHTECSAGWWEEVLPNDDQKQRIITWSNLKDPKKKKKKKKTDNDLCRIIELKIIRFVKEKTNKKLNIT